MIYTDMTKKAMKIMFNAHKNQTDKSGIPYVFHPWHVAEKMTNEVSTTVALLHDVVEDTKIDLSYLATIFPEEVLKVLNILTHNKKESYFKYIKRISENEIAREVKLADLKHNSDLTRLNEITDKDLSRISKYRRCIKYLEDFNKQQNKIYVK